MKRTVLTLGLFAVAAAFVLLLWQEQPRNTGWQPIRDRGVLRVGFAVEAPYNYLSEQGDISGQSPAVIEQAASSLGIKRVEWVLVPFAELIPSLLERRFDMIGISIFVTEPRSQQILFADPFVWVAPGMLSRADVAQGHWRSHRDFLLHSRGKIAVLTGSVEHRHLAATLPADRLLTVADVYAGRNAVIDGSAAALTLSVPALKWLAESASVELTVTHLPAGLTQPLATMPSAFAFHPEDAALLPDWNRAQAEVLSKQELSAMLHQLGFSDPPLADAPPRENNR